MTLLLFNLAQSVQNTSVPIGPKYIPHLKAHQVSENLRHAAREAHMDLVFEVYRVWSIERSYVVGCVFLHSTQGKTVACCSSKLLRFGWGCHLAATWFRGYISLLSR